MDVTKQGPYEYLTISDHGGIRLISLHPSPDKAAPVECNIIYTTLQQAKADIYDHYTALSYVWEDPTDTITISVNGHPLLVTKSLECALRHLRDERRTLNVWADGVCINQKDDAEKSKQVQQMGKVYETATHTIIFLGEGDPSVEMMLSGVLSQRDEAPSSSLNIHDELIQALNYLLRSPWFYRVWIFQELVLSRDPRIVYGALQFPWSMFCEVMKSVIDYLQDTGLELPELYARSSLSSRLGPSLQERLSLHQRIDIVLKMNEARLESLIRDSRLQQSKERRKGVVMAKVSTPSFSSLSSADCISAKGDDNSAQKGCFEQFLSVIASRRGFNTSDPRDFIFAHIGLVQELDLAVHYGMNTEQVFQMLVQTYITVTGSLAILRHREYIDIANRRPGLATWAVDWTLPRAEGRRLDLPNIGSDFHDEPQQLDHGYCFKDDVLFIHAERLHTMITIYTLSDVIDTTSYDSYLAERVPFIFESRLDRHDAFVDYDYKKDRHPASWLSKQLDGNQELAIFLSALAEQEHAKDPIEGRRLYRHLLDGISESIRLGGSILDGRRIACVKAGNRGFLALVPADCKVGDLVYIFESCAVPFVFRELPECRVSHESGENVSSLHVKLIGECLVDLFLRRRDQMLRLSSLVLESSKIPLHLRIH
ncbi:heterokaryon incompatibility protein-domain-containing protein [Hyaloscypha finlandica]|nr:heterokaryon incompatibility protein-domain-containing protein [Hyaloscypha finlandica]